MTRTSWTLRSASRTLRTEIDIPNPDGKLRLLYEANPLAFMVEQAGGAASDGRQRILEKVPSGLHQRTPLVIGSTEDVALYGEFVAGKR